MSTSLELPATTAPQTTVKPSGRIGPHLWILSAVCLLYLLQLWTPLRLTGDSIELLSIASSAADGHGFLDHGRKTHYLPGYPAMVVCLERVGAARPWGLAGLNAVFLLIGFGSAYYMARQYFQLANDWAVMLLCFGTLSFALIKHFTLPLTDIPFFGISMAALSLLVRAEKETGWPYYGFWVAAFSASAVAVLVRPVAIALSPCLVWSLGAHLDFGKVLRLKKGVPIAFCASSALSACALWLLLLRTKYIQEALSVIAHQGLMRGVRNILTFRIHEFGELFLNAPASKLSALSPLVWFFGVAAIAAALMCFRRRRLGLVEVYLMGYSLIMLVWPYGDTRFWTPVLPLIFAELFSVARPWRFTGWKRSASILYAAAYMLMGFAALAYSTRITFSGRDFPFRYGDHHLRSTYLLFYSDARADRSGIDESALAILQRYDPGNARGNDH